MVKTYNMLLDEYKNYSAPDNKIARMIKDGTYIKLRKGLYETQLDVPGYCFAGMLYGPSYLSFDFALSYYGLIPERVYTYTSATFEKRKKKRYKNVFGLYTYRDIPSSAFPLGIITKMEDGYPYRIATPEKALCDKLYILKPLYTQKNLMDCLVNDLRIDMDEFDKLDKKQIIILCEQYPSTNLKLLKKFMEKNNE